MIRSSWLKGSAVAPFAMVGLVAAYSAPGVAASDGHPADEALQQRPKERDVLVADLQRRVQELERQVALMRAREAPTAAKPVPPVPVSPVAAAEESKPRAENPRKAEAGTPGQFEVDEQAAERALERTLVVTGALLLPAGQAEVQTGFAYARSEENTAGPLLGEPLFADERSFIIGEEKRRRDILVGDVLLRFGLPFDSQLELDVPYRYEHREKVTEVNFTPLAETSDDDAWGLGDVRLGLAKGLLRERRWWPNLIGRITWDTDSGETKDGITLGSGFNEVQASLTATKRQDPLVFIGGASYEIAFEDNDIDPGNELGFSIGAILAASPETSLRVILNQRFVDELKFNNRVIGGSDKVIGTLVLGASSIVGRGTFLDLTAGIGLTEDAPDYSVGITFSTRFDFPILRF